MSEACGDSVIHVVKSPVHCVLDCHDILCHVDHNISCMGTQPLCNPITNVSSISLCLDIKSRVSELQVNKYIVHSPVCNPSTDNNLSRLLEIPTRVLTVDECVPHSNISRFDMRHDTINSSSKPLPSFSDVLDNPLLSSYCRDQCMPADNDEDVCTRFADVPSLRLWNATHITCIM